VQFSESPQAAANNNMQQMQESKVSTTDGCDPDTDPDCDPKTKKNPLNGQNLELSAKVAPQKRKAEKTEGLLKSVALQKQESSSVLLELGPTSSSAGIKGFTRTTTRKKRYRTRMFWILGISGI
jgi:hypothetical protein